MAGMGLGAYRFSLEWSRIEPAEGEFSLAALDYYRRICAACRERNIAPVVTFHHFTTPNWLCARGGWEAADAPEAFARFVTRSSPTSATSSAGHARSTSSTSSASWAMPSGPPRPG